MADEFDLDFEDDDLGLDDDLDFDMDPMAERPPAKNSREAATNLLKDASVGFTDDIAGDPLETANEIAKSAIPAGLSKESDIVFELKDKLKDEVTQATGEIKSQAKGTIKALAKLLPKSEKVTNIANKLMSFIGDNDDEASSGPSAEQIQNDNITSYITDVMGQKSDRESMEDVINQQIEANRHKTTTELTASIATNTESIRKFNNEITNSYFRRSLELQYKSLFTAKEQLSVIKAGMDTFKNQFEGILHNTALPDIVKTRNSEELKAHIRGKIHNSLSGKYFSDDNLIGKVRKNLTDKVTGLKDQVLGGMSGIRDAADQKSMMDDMGAMGGTKSGMVGSLAAGLAKSKFGEFIGKKISGSEKAQGRIHDVKNAFMDPRAFFKGQQEAEYNEDGSEKLGSKVKNGLFSFMEDLTGDKQKANEISIGKTDLQGVASFDGRAHSSITKIIPGLLSKIYGEVKTIRTGGDNPEENEITYSHNDDTFKSAKELMADVKGGIKSDISKDSVYYIDRVIDMLSKEGGLKVDGDKDLKELRKGFMSYLMDGGTIAPGNMINEGLLDHFGSTVKDSLESSMNATLTKSKKETDILDEFNYTLKNIKDSIPDMAGKVDELNNSGNLNILEDMGLVTRDKITKQASFSNEKYKQFVLEQLEATDTGDIQHLLDVKAEEIDKLKEEEAKANKTYKDKLNTLKDMKDKTVTRFKESDTGKKASSYASDIMDSARSKVKDVSGVVDKIGTVKDDVVSKAKSVSGVVATKVGLIDKESVKKTAMDSFGKAKTYGAGKLSKFKVLSTDGLEAMRTKFLASDAYKTGSVKTFDEYLTAFGYKQKKDTIKDSVTDMFEKAKEVDKQSILDGIERTKVYGSGKLSKLKTLSKEAEDTLRNQYFNSMEYKEGTVASFGEYVDALGYQQHKDSMKQSIKDTLAKARTLDKKLFKGGVALGKKMLGIGKDVKKKFKTLTENQESVLRAKFFASMEYKDGTVKTFEEYLNAHGFTASKEAAKGMFKKGLGRIKGMFGKGLSNSTKVTEKTKDTVTTKVDSILEFLKKDKTDKKPKKSLFDSDGDGDRDGNWKERLAGKKKKGDKKPGLLGKVVGKGKSLFDGVGKMLLMAVPAILGMLGKVPKLLIGGFKVIKTIATGVLKLPGLLTKLPKLLGGIIGKLMGGLGKMFSSAKNLLGIGTKAGTKVVAKVSTKVATSGVAAKVVTKVASKAATSGASAAALAAKAAPKPKAGMIKTMMSKFTTPIMKKFGKKGGIKVAAKLTAKIAARAVPFVGTALLAYDAVMIAKDMWSNKTSLKSAVSKQILGFDLFNDDEAAVDDEGNPIKPDEKKLGEKKKPEEGNNVAAENKANNKPYMSQRMSSRNRKGHSSTPANNLGFDPHKKGTAGATGLIGTSHLNKYTDNVAGDGVSEDSTRTKKETSGGGAIGDIHSRGGPYSDPSGGFNNMYKNGKAVDYSGFHPTFAKHLAAMANEYNELTGEKIPINSGYRSYAYQAALKKKYPRKAATPGRSPHEFGLAFDTNTSVAEKLDKLGLMKKYGFTRPVGKETWHVEAIGNSIDMGAAKKDASKAEEGLQASLGRGGGGWGSGSKGSNKNRGRNVKHQASIMGAGGKPVKDDSKESPIAALKPANNTGIGKSKMGSGGMTMRDTLMGPKKPANNITPSNDVSTTSTENLPNTGVDSAPKPKAQVVAPVVAPKAKKITSIDEATSNLSKIKNDQLVKPMQNNMDLTRQANTLLAGMSNSLEQSLNVQVAMLETLKRIEHASPTQVDVDTPKAVTSGKGGIGDSIRNKSMLPEPTINLKRKADISA